MTKREEYLAAYRKGELLQVLAAPSAGDLEERARLVAELHNEGAINFLGACCSNELDALDNTSVFRLQSVFDRALPQIECTVEDASAACDKLYEKVEGNLAAGSFYHTLQKWLEQDLRRIEEGLALVRAKAITRSGTTQSVLLAGAAHDRDRFAAEAIELSRESDEGIRIDAIRSLGMIPLEDEDAILPLVLNRLEEVIDAPLSDVDTGFAIQAALQLLVRIGAPVSRQVEQLFTKACRNPNPATLRAVAIGLALNPSSFSESLLDTAVEVLQCVEAGDDQTIQCIDRALYQWDFDGDRSRVLALLMGLIGRSEGAVDLEQLDNVKHKFRECSGEVLGWYIISLFLPGNPRLGNAASTLIPFEGVPQGLDIDLSAFSLDPPWIPYLTRKILGYCRLNSGAVATLLLSCLRAVSRQHRDEVEDFVYEHFLLNFPGAIEQMTADLGRKDRARVSVRRLSKRIDAYLDEIKKIDSCDAFHPSERNLALQFQRRQAQLEAAQREAQKDSLFLHILPVATMLYGTKVISYAQLAAGQEPVRQERELMRHTVQLDSPRMEKIDPVGHLYWINKFRTEKSPK